MQKFKCNSLNQTADSAFYLRKSNLTTWEETSFNSQYDVKTIKMFWMLLWRPRGALNSTKLADQNGFFCVVSLLIIVPLATLILETKSRYDWNSVKTT